MNPASNIMCDRLDDFLDGALSPQELAVFRTHLESCAACREAVDQQRWIDALLTSNDAAAIESLPQSAPRTIPLPRSGRRRALVAAASAAAIVALTASIVFPLAGKRGLGEGRPTAASHLPPKPTAPDAAEPPSLQISVDHPSPSPPISSSASFVSAGSAIAVPLASGDPQVTIVQLYPTVTAQRRWAREAAMRSSAISPNGG
jgi:anti-sigma factor RsiW